MVRKVLLVCGILSSLLYPVATDVIAASRYDGYNPISQHISELDAIGAPSGPVLFPLILFYDALVIAFGIGVWRSAQGKRALRVASGLIMAYGALGFVAIPFPMTQRGDVGVAFTDVMHIILMGVVPPLLMFAAVAFGAAAFGKRFRLYSILTLATILVGDVLTFYSARIGAAEPLPWSGVAERVVIGAWLLWVAVLAAALLRARVKGFQDSPGRRRKQSISPGLPAEKEVLR